MPGTLACRICPSRFFALLLILLAVRSSPAQVTDLRGSPSEPLHGHGKVHVLLFVRTDCPITNRYAPELRRIADYFSQSPVDFFLVYSGKAETAIAVQEHLRQYMFPGRAILDPQHQLAERAHATIAPEAAV